MEKRIAGIADYPLCEYLLVLRPHEDLYNRIMEVKQSFAKAFDCVMAGRLKPHITLVQFVQYEMMEARILQRLRAIATEQAPFSVTLENYGCFPSHTIYLHVASRLPVVSLVKALRPAQRLMKPDNDNKPHFITEPHLTIARKLLPWQYEKGWQLLAQQPFSGRFMAEELLLLKRKAGGEKQYETLEKLVFHSRVVSSRQGKLFS